MSTGVDREQLTRLMNEDLATEYRSIVQYNQHIATLTGLEVQSLLAELKQHLWPGAVARDDPGRTD